jgi:hypothetical protein
MVLRAWVYLRNTPTPLGTSYLRPAVADPPPPCLTHLETAPGTPEKRDPVTRWIARRLYVDG